MKKGEKATIICPPDYAYGAEGYPPHIPPNTTLKFDVEVLDYEMPIRAAHILLKHKDCAKPVNGRKGNVAVTRSKEDAIKTL